jgi:hypothetical protein
MKQIWPNSAFDAGEQQEACSNEFGKELRIE